MTIEQSTPKESKGKEKVADTTRNQELGKILPRKSTRVE